MGVRLRIGAARIAFFGHFTLFLDCFGDQELLFIVEC